MKALSFCSPSDLRLRLLVSSKVVRTHIPGMLVCLVCGLAATFVSEHHGGPQLLYALLIGLSMNFLFVDEGLRSGINFCARTCLRIGVALLGVRITVGQIANLGSMTAIKISAAVILTIGAGLAMARLLRRPQVEGLISGCSVGICGASAALTVASVLPPTQENERFTLLAVIGVTLFSTVAMVVYPPGLVWLGMGPTDAGIFLGGTIHDVAQVVASAMLLGERTADTATVVKLFRVALLAPIVMLIAVAYRTQQQRNAGAHPPLVPWFLGAFLLLVAANSVGMLSQSAVETGSQVSRWLLIVAIAASGIKTNFAELTRLGWVPVLMLLCETLFIAVFVLLTIRLVPN